MWRWGMREDKIYYMTSSSENESNFLSSGGEMGDRIRNMDWNDTTVGPIESWPQSLKTALSICLNATMPLSIIWGKELVQFYNDAYIPIAVGRHPNILGGTVPNNWPDTWDAIKQYFENVFLGKPSYVEDALLVTYRNGIEEECYYTMSFSPIRDESGEVGGVFHAILETSVEVIHERRLQTNRLLASELAGAKSISDIHEQAAQVFGSNLYDIPFSIFYRLSDNQNTLDLLFSTGIDQSNTIVAEQVLLNKDTEYLLPFQEVIKKGEAIILQDFANDTEAIIAEPWQVAVQKTILLPIYLPGKTSPYAIYVAGLSPRLVFDNNYRNFFDQLTNQVSTALANVKAFEEERKRVKALAEIDKAKTLFFSNVSHELRTPLTLMLATIEQLQTNEGNEELSMLHRNSLRLLKLVNSLLDFTRIEAGRLKATYQAVDLSQLTRDYASVFRSAIEKAGLSFELDIPSLERAVYLDVNLWERIVFNLLSNALKFTYDGGIKVQLQENSEAFHLVVEDSGTGISKNELPKLFSRFHRIEGVKSRSHEGTGIGLAMVKELVKMHGGQVEARSQLGQGSRFIITIPFGKDHLPQEQIRQRAPEERSSLNALPSLEDDLYWLQDGSEDVPSKTYDSEQFTDSASEDAANILIVDDNADMRYYLSRILSNKYNLRVAADGQQALEMIVQQLPDLVISDIMMPRLDGLGLLKAIRQDPEIKALPIIFLSARAGEEAKISGLEAGADDYLVKPFSARELLARINTQLAMSALRKEIHEKELEVLREGESQRANLKRIFQQTPAAIALLKGDELSIELANPKMCQIWNKNIDDIINKPVFEAIPSLKTKGHDFIIHDAIASGEPYEINELPIDIKLNAKTKSLYVNLVYQPLKNAKGEVDGIIAVMIEVNEQVLARQELEKMNRELIAVNADLDNFVYTASHDLKAPILNIESLIKILLPQIPEETLSSPQMSKVVQMIETSIERFKGTISDLSEIAKVQKEAKESIKKVNLEEVVNEVILDLELSIQQSEAEVITNIEDCPEIVFSPKNLRSIIYNLISNAIKYASPDRKPKVHIHCHQTYTDLLLSVKDNGLGIDLNNSKELFTMFKRLHTHVEGSGVGLYIVKRIIDNAGGKIEVESEPGKGSTFTVYLKK